MKRFLKPVLLPAACLIVVAGLLILGAAGCKSPTSPDGAGEADILVYNDYGETLDIYMDGVFKFWLTYKNTIEIDNVTLEEHELEARRKGTNVVVDSTTITVEEKVDYSWTVDDPPDINVTNKYGKNLKIYLDGLYKFELADNEDRWIIDVSFGERLLTAVSPDDGRQVASVTITIDSNADYAWTIEKITLRD